MFISTDSNQINKYIINICLFLTNICNNVFTYNVNGSVSAYRPVFMGGGELGVQTQFI